MPKTYLALGDSYTVGESVTQEHSFPYLLASKLEAIGFPIGSPKVIAQTGWATDELANAIADAGELGLDFGLVTLLVGVNNQYRGRPLDEYRNQFSSLVDKATQLAGNDPRKAVVISIPDWSVTPFAKGRNLREISYEIDLYNSAAQAICRSDGVSWIDVTGISREAATDASLIASDGLHPSAKMYARWIRKILPAAKNALHS